MHVLNRLHEYTRRLQSLADSDFFSPELNNDAYKLAQVCQIAIEYANEFDEYDLKEFQLAVSRVCLHLEGSTKNELPYVVDYCISRTIKDWCGLENFTIAHAFTDNDYDFYFDPYSWEIVLEFARKLNLELKLSEHLILIGTPRVFKNIPLYCSVLYHEAAHFVDLKLGISSGVFRNDEQNNKYTFMNRNHCAEFFADLFAASYIGETVADVLNILVPHKLESGTHPATISRTKSIVAYCRNEEFEVLGDIQSYLKDRNLNLLTLRFTLPNIAPYFDDGRPFEIQNEQELHGIWTTVWQYAKDLETGRDPGWPVQYSNFGCILAVSDLLEKSIINYIITANRKKPEKIKDLHGVKITPLLESDQIGDSSVDLRLGLDFRVPVQSLNPPIENVSEEDGCNSLSQHFQRKRREMDERFILRPNQVVLATTLEYVAMPNDVCGEVHIDSSFAARGISFRTNIASGFRGCVPIELINRGNEPVELIVGARMFRMEVEKLKDNATSTTSRSKHFALVRPDLHKLSDNTTLEQLQEFV